MLKRLHVVYGITNVIGNLCGFLADRFGREPVYTVGCASIFVGLIALLLAAIATGPFLNKHWWEHHFHHVALALGTLTTLYYVFGLGAPARMLHVAHEYVSFIALIKKMN